MYDALQAIKKCAEPTKLLPNVCMRYDSFDEEGRLSVFNGKVFGEILLPDIGTGSWNVNAANLFTVVNKSSKLSASSNMLVVQNGRSRFRLPLIDDIDVVSAVEMPDIEDDDWIELTSADADAIALTSQFASKTADHPWAASVTLFVGYAIATNNVCVACTRVPSFDDKDFLDPLTIPMWVIPLLTSGTLIAVKGSLICFQTTSNIRGYGLLLSTGVPNNVLDFSIKMFTDAPKTWHPIGQYREAFYSINSFSDASFILNRDSMTSDLKDGSSSAAELTAPVEHESMKLFKDAVQLILDSSTLVNFDDAPDKLRFSRDNPKMMGMSSTIAMK